MQLLNYTCSIEAEPVHRYGAGGYHPVHLGDVLQDNYRILHKLGWGGYSTVWAAYDRNKSRAVAIKIATAEEYSDKETRILRLLAKSRAYVHHGYAHLPELLDSFSLQGPNGTHRCVVMSIVGRNVGDLMSDVCKDDRLPARLVKPFARQAMQALDCLHEQSIAHGDVHVRNMALAIPESLTFSEKAVMDMLGQPEIAAVVRQDNSSLESGVSQYLVASTQWQVDFKRGLPQVRLIDLGEAFSTATPPKTLHTPLVVRPPEAIFDDHLDAKVDCWSMGCTLFELITGQPPFDSFFVTKPSLIEQMLESTGEKLPSRWEEAWQLMKHDIDCKDPEDMPPVQKWLKAVYFDDEKTAEFTHDDIDAAGCLIKRMLRLDPNNRPTMKELLDDPWLADS